MDDQVTTEADRGVLGYIEVSWPFGNDFDFEPRWRKIFPVLRAHGYDHRAFICGAFTSFIGTRDTADAVRAALLEIDPAFTLTWKAGDKSDSFLYPPTRNKSLADVVWPALCFGKPNCSLTLPRDEGSFAYRVASERSLPELLRMTELILVDSNGVCFDLSFPEYVEHPTNWWKIKSRLFNVHRPIQWTVTTRGKITADQLKEIVRSDIDEYESMWVEECGFEEMEAAIVSAATIKEIFDVLGHPPMDDIESEE